MKKLLSFASLALFALPLLGTACTTETIVKKKPADETTPQPDPNAQPDPATPVEPEPPVLSTPDKCLDGQDMDAADVDVKTCPAIPEIPDDAKMGTKTISLGAVSVPYL
jgi:hypothetical protein